MRPRTKVTEGSGSRAAGLAMVFKLIEAASERWRYVNGPHLVALVRTFEEGRLNALDELQDRFCVCMK